MKTKKNCDGFTLIEVVVVAVIVGILAAVAVPAYTTYISQSRTKAAASAAGSVATFCSSCLNAEGVLLANGSTPVEDGMVLVGNDDGSSFILCDLSQATDASGEAPPPSRCRIPARVRLTFINPDMPGEAYVKGISTAKTNPGSETQIGY